jgi:hypothetical protein
MLWVGHRLREPAVELGATITHLARVGLLRGKDCCTPTPEGTPEGTPTHNPLKLHLIHPLRRTGRSALYDERGMIGRATQSLTVRPR